MIVKLFGFPIFEVRGSDPNPENPSFSLSDPELWDSLGYSRTASGVNVNSDNAVTFSAVWSAVSLISRTIAAMPFKLFVRTNQGKEPVPDHPVYRLLTEQPNYYMNAFNFKDIMQAFVLLWGNAYAIIIRDKRMIPVELDLVHPSNVTPVLVNRKIYYNIQTTQGEKTYASYEILHLRGPGVDPLKGKSMIQIAADAIGLGLSAQKQAGSYFAEGGAIRGWIEHPLKLNDKTRDNISKTIKRWRANSIPVLDEGMKFHPSDLMPADDLQLLETRKFQIEEIARIYHVPLHKLQSLDRATNNNIEHQAIEYVQDCLLPWLVCWETECLAKLLTEEEKQNYFFKFNLNQLLRGDMTARANFYGKGLNSGWFSINEIRELEDMNRIENGDDHYVQVNLQNVTDPDKNIFLKKNSNDGKNE